MEELPYKEIIRYAMRLERYNTRSLAEDMGLASDTVKTTLGSRCGMTMENFLRYCAALDLTLIAEWEDPRGRSPKVRFRVG